jgi:hypothetical protein
MAGPVRRAGHGRFVDGTDVTWSVAEGQKGRRWREVRSRNGVVVSSLLLETFPDGRFAHLELSTEAGLLTLHPEGDRTLHGNAVVSAGVRHVVGFPWPDGSLIALEGSAIAIAAAAWYVREAKPPLAADGRRPAVMIDAALELHAAALPADALTGDRIDADGLPLLEDGATWPMEVDAG